MINHLCNDNVAIRINIKAPTLNDMHYHSSYPYQPPGNSPLWARCERIWVYVISYCTDHFILRAERVMLCWVNRWLVISSCLYHKPDLFVWVTLRGMNVSCELKFHLDNTVISRGTSAGNGRGRCYVTHFFAKHFKPIPGMIPMLVHSNYMMYYCWSFLWVSAERT